jgi:hypothetical protein
MTDPTPSEKLVGLWSADHMYGPGAHSDEIVIFKPDGTGRLDIINLTLCCAMEFRWQVSAENKITIHGTQSHQRTDSGIKTDTADLHLIDQQFGIAKEKTPSGCEILVLRLRLIDGISDHFGFVRSSISGFEEPHFD